MNYVRLALPEITAGIHKVGEDARLTFGRMDEWQLNWKPDESRWSVGQCFDHLVSANRQLVDRAKQALRSPSRTIWQRLPVWPAMFGSLLIRSQGPKVGRKYTASPCDAREPDRRRHRSSLRRPASRAGRMDAGPR